MLADQADVAWGGEVVDCRGDRRTGKARRARDRVASIGPLTAEQHARALRAKFGTTPNLNRAYMRLRQVKSEEEIDWLRIGAHYSDLGMAACATA